MTTFSRDKQTVNLAHHLIKGLF